MPDLDYVKVTGRFGITIGDGPDPDETPDTIWCDQGTIRIIPLNTYTKVAGGTPDPWTAGHSVIAATIDENGYVTWRDLPHVWVVDLTSDKVNPRIDAGKATHRIEFENLKAGGTAVTFQNGPVRLAADVVGDDGAVDLTLALPVPVAGGTPITVGARGVGIDSVTVEGGELLVELTNGTVENAGPLPVGPGGSDTGVASYLTAPASASRAAAAAVIVEETGAARQSEARVPDGVALRRVRLALDAVLTGTGQCRIVFGPGDSNMVGLTSVVHATTPAELLLDALVAAYPSPTDAAPSLYLAPWNQVVDSNESPDPTYPVDLEGSIVPIQTAGLGLMAVQFTGYGTGSLTVTDVPDIDIHYRGGPTSGVIFGLIDSDPGTIFGHDARADANQTHTFELTGLTPGTHVIDLLGGDPGTYGTLIVEGWTLHPAGRGANNLRMYVAAQSGHSAEDYVTHLGWVDSTRTVDPHLSVFGIGANDALEGRTVAVTKPRVQQMIDETNEACTEPPTIILLAYYQLAAGDWRPWMNMYAELAAENDNVLVVPIWDLFGSDYGTTRGGLIDTDTYHPTPAGNRLIVRRLMSVLAG